MARAPGRPRDRALTERILEVTAQQLAANGYERLTIEGIARAAEVSRSTVYKRWPHLFDLALDAVVAARAATAHFSQRDVAVPDTGSLRGDLVAVARAGIEVLQTLDEAGILRGLIADSIRHPRFGERLQAEILAPDEARYAEIFRRAAERGELSHDADVAELVPRVLSSFGVFQWVVVQQPPPPERFEAIVDMLLRGVLSR